MTRGIFLKLLALVPPGASVDVVCRPAYNDGKPGWGVFLRCSQACFPSDLPPALPGETAFLAYVRTNAASALKAQRYRRWLAESAMEG